MAFGIAPKNLDALRYEGENLYILPAIEAPRAPLPTDTNYPLFTIWRNANKAAVYPNAEGDMWVLTKFNQTGSGAEAVWNKLSPGDFEGVHTLSDTAGTVVNANAFGNIQLQGGSGVSITSNPGSNLLNISLVGGGTAIDQVAVETGTSPVVPNGSGQISLTSTTQTAVGTADNGVLTTGTGANSIGLALQQAGQAESIDTRRNGIAHFQGGSFFVQGGFVKSAPQPGVENLGFVYNSGTGVFKLRVIYGSVPLDPSLTQPGIFNVNTAGVISACSVTANQSFTDANGTSTIVGNLFGFQNTDVVSTDIPFYLYGVVSGSLASACFMISRLPNMTVSPVIGDIGYSGNPVADNQYSFFALSPFPEAIGNYVSQPCVCLGSFRMRLAAGGNWTVQSLTPEDSIGRFQENTIFTFPTGILGAATNTHFTANGGTAPVFSTRNFSYMITREGYVNVAYQGQTLTTDGVGAVTATLILPFKGPVNVINAAAAKGNYGVSAGSRVMFTGDVLNTQAAAQFVDTNSVVQNVDIAAPADIFTANIFYKPAIS